MTVLRHYKMTARDGEADALRAALRHLAGQVRPLEGCERVELFVDPRDARTFVFIEHWRSMADHKAGGAALGKEAFNPVSAVLESMPEGRYLDPIN